MKKKSKKVIMEPNFPSVFILKIVKQVETFYLDSPDRKDAIEQYCNEPMITLLMKRRGDVLFSTPELKTVYNYDIPSYFDERWAIEVLELPFTKDYLFHGKFLSKIKFDQDMKEPIRRVS